MIGKQFNNLLVVDKLKLKKGDRKIYVCVCVCGNITMSCRTRLTKGRKVSCGCQRHEPRKSEVEKQIRSHWRSMRYRCENEGYNRYHRYGGRGISVTPEWQQFETFYKWSVANGFEAGLSLDRIDNDGDYHPDNCRWSDAKTQARNKSTNRMLHLRGEDYTLADACERFEVPYSRVLQRLHLGWEDEAAVFTPKKRKNKALSTSPYK